MTTSVSLPHTVGPVFVRHIRESDLSALYDIESNQFLKQYIQGGHITEPRDEWIANARRFLLGSDIQFALEDVATAQFIGRGTLGHFVSGLNLNPQHREVQVVLGRLFLGKHLGRAACCALLSVAFRLQGATTVFAVVHPSHKASLALVKDLGFLETNSPDEPDGTVMYRVFELSASAHNYVLKPTVGE